MSATFPLKIGDTQREMSRRFRIGGRLIPNAELTGVVARIKREGQAVLEKTMIRDTNDGLSWFYSFSDAEMIEIGAGEHKVDFRLLWPSGRRATDPTVGDGYPLIAASPL